MKHLELVITYNEVISLVHMQTAYEAKNTPPDVAKDGTIINDDKFHEVRSSHSEDEILCRFWDSATAELAVVLRSFDGHVLCSHNSVETSFDLPDNWDENLTGNIRASIIDTIVSIICAKWFELTLPAKQELYLNQATSHEANIINALCARLRPTQNNTLDNSQSIELV